MVAVGISEFTFGYAFLYEQTHANWGDLQAAPILPSLVQEQEEGWDAHLPLAATDFYYQFKLTDYLSRGNATFIADGTYNGPYYRFSFHRRNNNQQHHRLRVEDVNDSDLHHITFQPNDPEWIQHSEKKRHEYSITGRELGTLYRGTRAKWRPVNEAFTTELFDKTTEVVRRVIRREHHQRREAVLPLLDFNPNQAERKEVLVRTSQILSVVLGVTLVLVGANE